MSRNLLTPSERLLLVSLCLSSSNGEYVGARQINNSNFKMHDSQLMACLNTLVSNKLIDLRWSNEDGKLSAGRPYRTYKINEAGITYLINEGLA